MTTPTDPPPPDPPKPTDAERARAETMRSLSLGLAVVVAIGAVAVVVYAGALGRWSVLAVALMVAAGSFMAGGLLGFLFGIPQSLTGSDDPADTVQIEDFAIGDNCNATNKRTYALTCVMADILQSLATNLDLVLQGSCW